MKSKWTNRRFLLALLCVVIAGMGLAAGVSYSWFIAGKQLSSVAKIQQPADLKILNPDESQMTKIDLSYTDDDVIEENGKKKVTIQRPIMIDSGSKDYDLILAHTTNISGMEISLFRAKEINADQAAQADIKYPDGLTYRYWQKLPQNNIFQEGSYLNRRQNFSPALADSTYNNKTFTEDEVNGNLIQKNASPLYWKKEENFESSADADIGNAMERTSNGEFRFRYILQLSWTETEKETDIFYLIAQQN